MGNPVFRFTLSHTPRQSVSTSIVIPPNSEGVNIAGSGNDWSEGANPAVTVSGSSGARASDKWANGYAFGTGLSYTINYSVDYNINVNVITHQLNFVILDIANNVIVTEVKNFPGSGSGTLNESSTFTAPGGAVKFGFFVNIFNLISNAGSTFDINAITGTVATPAETGSASSIVISEPSGWIKSTLKNERHPDFHSLVEYFETGLTYYGENNVINGGIDYIKSIEARYGFDTNIEETIDADIDGDGVFEENIFTGLKDLTGLNEVPDNKVDVPTIRNDMWSKFISRLDTPVDLRSNTDLDGNPCTPVEPVDINLTPQIVRKIFNGVFNEPNLFAIESAGGYIQFYPDQILNEEIKQFQGLYTAFNPEIPVDFLAVSEGNAGMYSFDIRITISAHIGVTIPPGDVRDSFRQTSAGWKLFFQKNNDTPIQFTVLDVDFPSPPSAGSGWSIYTYTGVFELAVGDQIRVYGDEQANLFTAMTIWTKQGAAYNPLNSDIDIYPNPTGFDTPSYFTITADTTYPLSEGKGFYLHDAFAGVVERIVGRNAFYSEILGRLDTNMRQYDTNGCYSKNVIMRGLQIRGYTLEEKPFSISFNQLWKGSDPIFNLGLGYETIEGTEYIRIEEKAYFYDATSTSVNISNVRQITREYDPDKIYNKIEVGFNRWESEDISGLDDAQTKRVYTTRITKVKKTLTIHSDFIAASTAWETTRRQKIEKSKDYKYDNETFILAINDNDVSPDRYNPEIDENFDSISGLLNSDTRYNSILTPMRNLLRWGNVWNGCLFQNYQSSYLKFVSGEGNFDMSSDYSCASGSQCLAVLCDNLSEKQDIPLGPPSNYGGVFGYLHLPMLYNIEIINFSWDDYLVIRNNRHKAIGISQTDTNHKRFFVKEIDYEICKGKVKIVAWPYDYLNISVVPTNMPDRTYDETIPSECSDFFVPEYTAILDYATAQGFTLPSSDQQCLQNQLVIDLKNADVWDNLDILYVFANDGGEDFAKINWVSPGTFTPVKNGTVTFTTNVGYQGNGTNGYLDNGWIPSTHAVNYQANNASAFCYINNDVLATRFDFGVNGAINDTSTILISRAVGDIYNWRINFPSQQGGTSTNSIGFHHLQKRATDARILKNGTQVGSAVTVTATGVPTRFMPLFANNNNGSIGSYSSRQMGIFGLGAAFEGNESALYGAWNAYFTSL